MLNSENLLCCVQQEANQSAAEGRAVVRQLSNDVKSYLI